MTVNILDVMEITCKFRQDGQELRNVYQVINTGPAAISDANFIVDSVDWAEYCYAPFYGDLSTNLEFTYVQLVNVTQEILLGDYYWPSITAGLDGSQALPLQVAAVLRFPTDYRGSQGRKFIPGITSGNMEDDGHIATAFQAVLGLGADRMAYGFTSGTSYFRPGVDNPVKLRFAAFQYAIVNDIVGIQRRRRQGVGI